MGKQADKMKVMCSDDDASQNPGNKDAWYAWLDNCVNLDASLQDTCKGISLDEFIKLYAGGKPVPAPSGSI
jgi:hypothetical protein